MQLCQPRLDQPFQLIVGLEVQHITEAKPVVAMIVAGRKGMKPQPVADTRAGRGTITGGRRPLRHVLFQIALAAACHNPILKPVAKRLKERGKPHKLVMIATARRRVTIANAIIKTGKPWQIQSGE